MPRADQSGRQRRGDAGHQPLGARARSAAAAGGDGAPDRDRPSHRMKKLFLVFAVLALTGASSGQEYPSRPVRVVVPYVAGGAADIFARTLGQKLSEAFKQGFVVENKPGANGGIGADFVAKSAPDGYTLLATASGPIVVNPVLYATVPYDPVRDFVPVAQATVYQYVLVALASSPLRGIDDVVAAARARPGAITYGSTGFGGGNHLAGELLALKTNTRLTHVPYKGSAAALADLLGGQLCRSCSTRSSRRCRRSAPGSCAPSPSRAASARRRSPRCRRCRRQASRGSTFHNGRAFSRPPARRARSSSG
ncbi:MAG: tripartite tricarboxylate transporter substrate binding protein [Betaproteobacteria bacterium]|nr:MAG: tripartite tricarboxylate transporter substrate binding protein [Betaproteobacteria bacterium]